MWPSALYTLCLIIELILYCEEVALYNAHIYIVGAIGVCMNDSCRPSVYVVRLWATNDVVSYNIAQSYTMHGEAFFFWSYCKCWRLTSELKLQIDQRFLIAILLRVILISNVGFMHCGVYLFVKVDFQLILWFVWCHNEAVSCEPVTLRA